MKILASATRFYSILLIVSLVWIYLQRRLRWSLLARFEPTQLLLDLILACVAALFIVSLSIYASRNFTWGRLLDEQFRKILVPLPTWEIGLLAFMSGLVEEFFFRGALQPILGIILTSLIFGSVHFVPRRAFIPWSFYAAFAGFVMGILFEISRTLFPAMLAHALINFVLILNLNHRQEIQPI